MAIHELFPQEDVSIKKETLIFTPKSFSFSSSLMTRLFSLFLLSICLIWTLFAVTAFCISFMLNTVSAFLVPILKRGIKRRFSNVRRSVLCTFCLMIALVSPSFGMMVGCSYFLMHDKEGIDQVIPRSLRGYFKQF
jgi:predicted PurR-regulated permease PerM